MHRRVMCHTRSERARNGHTRDTIGLAAPSGRMGRHTARRERSQHEVRDEWHQAVSPCLSTSRKQHNQHQQRQICMGSFHPRALLATAPSQSVPTGTLSTGAHHHITKSQRCQDTRCAITWDFAEEPPQLFVSHVHGVLGTTHT